MQKKIDAKICTDVTVTQDKLPHLQNIIIKSEFFQLITNLESNPTKPTHGLAFVYANRKLWLKCDVYHA